MSIDSEDLYRPTREVSAILRKHWPTTGKPKGEAIVAFASDMQHAQLDLLEHYRPIMDPQTAARAQRTTNYLYACLARPGSAGFYPVHMDA